ncbi:cold shock domain-containing protein [Aeromonas bestiarum]|uniref:cold shock domain-containing protein n=1 Tax=Aeromonas bestiarum TaxID=105751 RepID=UPI00050310F2|nr:cold shock domain-containing protein [Aeromonas bestiarum]KFN20208.1 DNA-binding protein [Aeromonas bestiarum]
MRYQGRIASWNEARGFGFITPEQQGCELFVHISALQSDGRLPEAGERVSYQIGRGKDDKPRAVQVFFPDRPLSLADTSTPPLPGKDAVRRPTARGAQPPVSSRPRPGPSYRRKSSWRGKLIPLLVLAGLFSVYSRFSAESVSPMPASSFSQEEAGSSYSPTFVRQCDGRQYCSQMTSCEEATWFLQNCPNTKMDGRGRGNGIPCESQWCGH